jgi:hypothetical protein
LKRKANKAQTSKLFADAMMLRSDSTNLLLHRAEDPDVRHTASLS